MGALRSLQLSPQSINRDAPPTRLGVEGQSEWSYGKNVRFVAQAGYSAAGEAPTYSGLPYIALWARWGIQRGVPVVFYVGTTYIGCYDGAHHNLTPAGWHRVMRPEDVTGIVFNDFAVINALPNAPIYIPLSHDVANPLPGWDATWTCAGIASFKSFLVALGAMTPNPGFQYNTVRWSDSADPGTLPGEWEASPTNDAGLLEASQAPGWRVAAGGHCMWSSRTVSVPASAASAMRTTEATRLTSHSSRWLRALRAPCLSAPRRRQEPRMPFGSRYTTMRSARAM